MTQIYQIISIVTFSLAAVSLGLAVILWFKFRIWKIIGDLSGRTAKKSIERMRSANEKSGRKSYRPTPVEESREKLRKPVILEEKDTDVLQYSANGTEVLSNGTVPLDSIGPEKRQEAGNIPEKSEVFKVLQRIVLIHTEEVI